jgi:hypothetical protein
MLVINQMIPGTFEVLTDRGAYSLDQEELLKKLKEELGLEFEYLSPEIEEENKKYKEFKEQLDELLKCDLVQETLLVLFNNKDKVA